MRVAGKTASDSDPDFQEPSKQEKYQVNSNMLDDQPDDMPFCFYYIWSGLRLVSSEYYKLTHKLKSELHLSEAQAQGAISLANILYGRQKFREWKIYEKGKEVDYNTLPAPTNMNRTKPYFEIIILASFVTEIRDYNYVFKWWFIKNWKRKFHCSVIHY